MITDNYDEKTKTLALVKYAGVTPRGFDLLLAHFRSLDNIMLAEISELVEIEGISESFAKRVYEADQNMERAAAYKTELAKRNIHVTTRFETDYPVHLLEINDPPPFLYVRGKTPDTTANLIALVGTEEASQEGIALTIQSVKEFSAKKVQVVSSLNKGIDAAVHLGLRSGGADSFAMIDRGFDHIEGEGAVPLAIDIVKSGGIISEYPPDELYAKKNFKETNRLIAGMAQAVVVTEFGENSNRVSDILEYCHQVGKLSFILVDPANGPIPDEKNLANASRFGAIIMTGPDKVNDIVKSLVL